MISTRENNKKYFKTNEDKIADLL